MAYAWELPEFDEIRGNAHPSDPEADRLLTDAALENIGADPLGWVGRNTAKLAIVSYQSFAQELAILLAVVGAVAALAREKLVLVPLAVVATLYVVQFPVFTEARYFLPLVPLYALFLAQGLATVGPPIKRWLDQAAEQERDREAA